MRSFTGEDQVDGVREMMKEQKPIIVFFYMDGCPYCESTKPFWEELKQKKLPKIEFVEVESAAVPPESGISGFPQFLKKDPGRKAKTVVGSKKSLEELASSLGINLAKSGGLRRLTRGRRSRKLTRRVRKRLH